MADRNGEAAEAEAVVAKQTAATYLRVWGGQNDEI